MHILANFNVVFFLMLTWNMFIIVIFKMSVKYILKIFPILNSNMVKITKYNLQKVFDILKLS